MVSTPNIKLFTLFKNSYHSIIITQTLINQILLPQSDYKMENSVKIQFLGGVEEVGRLSMVLETNDIRLLFEYGMLPSKPPEYPLPAPPVDLVLLTHAHLDHSGMIPWLFSKNDQKILTTDLTNEIAHLLHKDTIKIIQQMDFEFIIY